MIKENIINKDVENIHGSFLISKSTTGQLSSTKLPDSPGIYLFKKGNSILYIGKATSLKDRVKSYFSKDIIATRGPLIVDMVFNADKIDFIKTDSVLEALILESSLIKKYQPKYNTKEKDDKSYNYVVITDEDFPRVLVERGRNLSGGKRSDLTCPNISFRRESQERSDLKEPVNILYQFGPFTNGTQLKEALKIIRKIFPFRDRCLPVMISQQNIDSQKQNRDSFNSDSKNGSINKEIMSGLPVNPTAQSSKLKACFNYQIGLCPGVCVGKISKEEYVKSIKNIKLFFEGKKTIILKNLEKEMHALAKKHEFEKASQIKKIIFALNHIQDVSLIKDEYRMSNIEYSERKNFRIEAYDIAHLSGTNTVGVMVVLENGELSKNEYRKFIIKESIQNDIAGLKEIIERRLKHTEWAFPQMIVVDGGKAQINIVKRVLFEAEKGLSLPTRTIHSGGNLQKGETLKSEISKIKIVSVLKNEYHKPKAILGDKILTVKYSNDILIANNEAHRFAIKYHKSKRIIM